MLKDVGEAIGSEKPTELNGLNPARLPKMKNFIFQSSVDLKSNAPTRAVKYQKAGKGDMDEMTSSELYKLIEYLKAQGWTDKEIVKLIEYITR